MGGGGNAPPVLPPMLLLQTNGDFFAERSTTHVLLSAVHDWLVQMEKANKIAIVSFDLTKALDSVPPIDNSPK